MPRQPRFPPAGAAEANEAFQQLQDFVRTKPGMSSAAIHGPADSLSAVLLLLILRELEKIHADVHRPSHP